MKILVTGATSFIASALIDFLRGKHDVIALSSSNGEDYIYCKMEDYGSLPDIIDSRDIDVCIHFAWSGIKNQKNNYDIQHSNVVGTISLINALSVMNVKRFIGIGTIAEKEVINYHPYNHSVPRLNSMYGVCKLHAHFLSKMYCNELGIQYTWCTLANVYGPGDTTENFIKKAMSIINSDSRASFTEGKQLYDFIYIDDLIDALSLVIDFNKSESELYIGSGDPRPLFEYIEVIRDAINPSKSLYLGDIPYNNAFLKHQDYCIDDIVNLGFSPQTTFEEGLNKSLSWYLQLL